MFPTGTIVWTGQDPDRLSELGSPCTLTFCQDIAKKEAGCYCPKGAIPFLKSIGIQVRPSHYYQSGFKAIGCIWHRARLDDAIDPIVLARSGNATNEDFLSTLKQF